MITKPTTNLHVLTALEGFLDPSKPVILSALAPFEIVESITSKNNPIIFADTTLQGLIDPKQLKIESADAQIVLTPFCGAQPDEHALKSRYPNLSMFTVPSQEAFVPVHDRFRELFAGFKAFSMAPKSSGARFALFLEPAYFCPKQDILEAMREAGIGFDASITPHASLFGAQECARSFIGLHADIALAAVDEIAEKLAEIFSRHRLRACTF